MAHIINATVETSTFPRGIAFQEVAWVTHMRRLARKPMNGKSRLKNAFNSNWMNVGSKKMPRTKQGIIWCWWPGGRRNRTTDTRIFNSVPQTKLPLDLKRFTPPESSFVHTTFLGVCLGLIWLSYFDPHKDSKRVWWPSENLTDTRITNWFVHKIK